MYFRVTNIKRALKFVLKRYFFMKRSILLFLLAAYVAGLAGAFTINLLEGKNYGIQSQIPRPVHEISSPNTYPNANNSVGFPDFTAAAEISTKAVVYIKTTSNQPQASFNDWFFGDFFGNRNQLVINSGSGVIISPDGYIVTNNHVIEKAVKVEIILNDKQAYEAEIVGKDPSTDLALLKINSKNLPTVALANSNALKVGEWVLAVGNPFNLTSTVTAGIVSAKGRNLNILNNVAPIESFIQTDAAINPGNSGGALVNTSGELVGINTAILSRTGAYNGYGFAVPANIVNKVVKDLKEFGSVQRAFFGADVIDIDAVLKDKLKLETSRGVYVNAIAGFGPAKEAKIKEGDIIVKLNGVQIDSKASFDEQLSYYRPGEEIGVTILRDSKLKDYALRLTNSEGNTDIIKKESVQSTKLGAEFEAISKVEREKYKIAGGVRITNVGSGYIARLGLREGFILTHINKTEIKTATEAIDILENIRGNVNIEGIDQNGRKAFFSYFTY